MKATDIPYLPMKIIEISPQMSLLSQVIDSSSCQYMMHHGDKPTRVYISSDFLDILLETPWDVSSLEINGIKVFADNNIEGLAVYCR